VDSPLFLRFNLSDFLLFLEILLNLLLSRYLFLADAVHLAVSELVLEGPRPLLLQELLVNLGEEPLVVVGPQLVLEGVPPVLVLLQVPHGAHEDSRKVLLGYVESLDFEHGVPLLLPLDQGVSDCFVLLLDPSDFLLDFLLPVGPLGISPLVPLTLVLVDFFQLGLLLNLEDGLLHSLGEEHVEDGLDLSIVVEEVVVLDLGYFIYACLFGHVGRSRRFLYELVCLNFNIGLLGSVVVLLGQEVGEVDFYPGRSAGPQIIGRRLFLGGFEENKLLSDHLDLLLLTLLLDAQLFFLRRGQVLLDHVHIMSVASVDALIVHNIQSCPIFF